MTLAKRICNWWDDFAPYEEQPTESYIKRQIKDDKPGLMAFLSEMHEEMSVYNEEDERLFKELGAILDELSKI